MLLECSGYSVPTPVMGSSVQDGGRGPATPGCLWSWLSGEGLQQPDRPALIALHQPSDHLANLVTPIREPHHEYLQWSYGQLASAAERLASYLFESGVRRGDVVATFIDNSADWIVLLWACFRMGAALTPHDPTLLNRRDELQAVIRVVQPKVVVVNNAFEAAKFKSQSKSWPSLVQLVCRDSPDGLPENWRLLSSIQIPTRTTLPAPCDTDPSDVVFIQFSSGSLSQPKGCPHSVRSLSAQTEAYRKFYDSRWTSGNTRFLLTAKNFVSGCYLGCINAFSAGGSVVVPDFDFGAENTLKSISRTQATHMMLVPSQVRALLASPALGDHKPSSLIFVNIAGDSVNRDFIEKAKTELQIQRVILSWSMSEGGPVFGWQTDEHVQLYNNVPMVGRPLPGSSVKICAAGTRDPVPFGQTGEIHVSSDSVIQRYVDGTNAESFYTENDREWFITGDIAIMEDDGCVSIVGRSRDIIKCSGWALLPSIIEDYIKEYFGIESQAIGVPNPSTGEKPVAVIKVRRASADLKQELKQGLPRHQGSEYTLGAVYLLSELGLKDWPLGQTRKISKDDLRSAVLERFPSKQSNGYPFPMYDMGYFEHSDYRY